MEGEKLLEFVREQLKLEEEKKENVDNWKRKKKKSVDRWRNKKKRNVDYLKKI